MRPQEQNAVGKVEDSGGNIAEEDAVGKEGLQEILELLGVKTPFNHTQ